MSVAAKPNDNIMEWHARLGHVNVEDVEMIENHDFADGLHITDKKRSGWDACSEGKQTRSAEAQTYTYESAPTDDIGAVIVVNTKKKVKPHGYKGCTHSLHVVDNASSYREVFPMLAKSGLFPLLTELISRFEQQYDVRVKVIRSDNEFDTKKIRSWCAKHGIRQQLAESDELYSVGKVERRHRTLFDGMQAMMFDVAQASRFLLSEAL